LIFGHFLTPIDAKQLTQTNKPWKGKGAPFGTPSIVYQTSVGLQLLGNRFPRLGEFAFANAD